MKVRRIAITNITSYRNRTEFIFDNGINILIGPNGGGKTNLQRIIALTLSKYFIHQWQFRSDNNTSGVEVIDPWLNRNLQQAFPKHVDDDGDQLIEIELVPERRDIENIKTIGQNLEKFNQELSTWEKKYEAYVPFSRVDAIERTTSFIFIIRNLQLQLPEKESAEWAFREYLREFFIFLRVASRIPDLTLTSPVFFFSSDRSQNKNYEIQAGQLTEQTYFDGYRSAYQAAMGDSMNLMQWGTQHFVRAHRKAVKLASESDKTWPTYFNDFQDVKLLNHYLAQLGYSWGFRSDIDQLSYWFVLKKDGREFFSGMFSSGEREIVHFLLAMFALNVQDGLVLVDEPELHLHPRWQKIFLRLFRDLSPEKNNQFLVTTHSPSFVTPDTIDSVTRIYGSTSGSGRVALREVDLPEKKSLVRMINSQNNERLFFADTVVLVEGISDRLIFESLLENVAARFHVSAAVEVIEVAGKHNFADYKTILDGLKTPVFVVADQDYLTNIGTNRVRALFRTDFKNLWKTLVEDKKSTDRSAMIAYLDGAISTGNLAELRRFWNYFSSRRRTIQEPMPPSGLAILTAEYESARLANIFVLHEGEIEDYLPEGSRSIRELVEFVSHRHWINAVPREQARMELVDIACTILGLNTDSHQKMLAEARGGAVTFPSAVLAKQPRAGSQSVS